VRQIELTLERWRWLPVFETPPIVVNIPAFRLYAFRTSEDRESDMLRMDVIVGRSFPETQTPVFMAQMKHVVFWPYWDVPDSIVRDGNPRRPPFCENRLELVSSRRDDCLSCRAEEHRGTGARSAAPAAGPTTLGATSCFERSQRLLIRRRTASFRSRAGLVTGIRVGDPVALARMCCATRKGTGPRKKSNWR
jgi:hypothetical protein